MIMSRREAAVCMGRIIKMTGKYLAIYVCCGAARNEFLITILCDRECERQRKRERYR